MLQAELSPSIRRSHHRQAQGQWSTPTSNLVRNNRTNTGLNPNLQSPYCREHSQPLPVAVLPPPDHWQCARAPVCRHPAVQTPRPRCAGRRSSLHLFVQVRRLGNISDNLLSSSTFSGHPHPPLLISLNQSWDHWRPVMLWTTAAAEAPMIAQMILIGDYIKIK